MIEQAGPSRQLFETINFAFMKNFDFLVKIAIFWTLLLFLGDQCHKLQSKIELGGYIISLLIQPPSLIRQ